MRAPLEKLPLDTAGHEEDEPATVVAEPRDEETSPAEPTPTAPAIDETRPQPDSAIGHVLFVSTDAGYRIFERDGAPPSAGARIEVSELGGAEATVTGPRLSPLPADRRSCVAAVVEAGTG